MKKYWFSWDSERQEYMLSLIIEYKTVVYM